jgi:hypothetical protein
MSTLRVGIARRDITPSPGTELFGYPTVRFGHEVADGLNATALVLESGACLACIVSLDLCLIDEDDVAAVRREAEAATGIAPQNLTLCATHTHSGPTTVSCAGWGVKNEAYWAAARPRIVEAIAAAQSALQPARVGIGVTQTDTGVNRREVQPDGSVALGFNEWGPRDRDLTVLRFEGENGTLASLVHLGAHPTSRGSEPSVSRDWPGVMMDRVETITGAPMLFLNGAFGDVAPRTTWGGGTGDGGPAAREVGLRAAYDAMFAWRAIRHFHEMDVQTLSGEVVLPIAPLPPREEAERELAAHAGDEGKRGAPGAEWHYWSAVLRAHDAPPQTERIFHQTVTRLGPVAFAPFAGEIFAEIDLRLKQASPFSHTLCLGTSNGSHGYYVTREGYGRGGYEPWVARAYGAYTLAPGVDDALVQGNLKLLRELAANAPEGG